MSFQGSLDEFLSMEDVEAEKAEEIPQAEEPELERPFAEEPRTEGQAEAADATPCDCNKTFSMKELRLHIGSLYLYRKGGEWRAVADMDHVYDKCRSGLVRNIRALKRLFDHASRQADVFAVGKAADDSLYVHYVGSGSVSSLPPEFHGLTVSASKWEKGYDEAAEEFRQMQLFMQDVSGDVIEEALGAGAAGKATCCMHGRKATHKGAVVVYRKGGEWKVMADMDVYNSCPDGLKHLAENVKALKRVLDHVAEQMRMRIFAVSKDYHEFVTVHILDDFRVMWRLKLEGFPITLSRHGWKLDSHIDLLEKQNSHLEAVGEDAVKKALAEGEAADSGCAKAKAG